MYLTWYGLSSLILGILLFFPVRKFILGLNVNRHQRKVRRPITEDELETLKKKVSVLAAAIAVTFAFVYTRFMLMRFLGP